MYKVFIENKPLYFVESTKDLPKDTFFLFGGLDQNQVESITKVYKEKNNSLIFAVVAKNTLKAMLKSFSHYQYIEAAGGIVEKKKNGMLLFIKRNGFWDIPKGKLEKNEDGIAGAKREIEEECGISGLKFRKNICSTYHTYEHKGKMVLKKTYWFAFLYAGKEKLTAQTEEGITKVKWFEVDNLFKIRKNTFASIAEVLNNFIELNAVSKKIKQKNK